MLAEGRARRAGAPRRGPPQRAHRDPRLPRDGELRRPLDAELHAIAVPPEGLLLTDRLAERLGVRPGDTLRVEVLTGSRNQRDVPVAGTVRDLMGLNAYMDRDALSRLRRRRRTVSTRVHEARAGAGRQRCSRG